MTPHVIDPTTEGPFDRCLNCGQPISNYSDGRGLITMVSGNPECYGKEAVR